jgi:myo-inositol-hexaphosphate 3-phosphohydrolase
MVVDTDTGTLYVGQENFGVWKFEASPSGSSEPILVDTIKPAGNVLEPDVEGLTIYYGPGTSGYLIASSQGDDTFAVYERDGNEYLGSFRLGAGPTADATEESDGAAVVGMDLFVPGMRGGLFVSQDGSDEPEVLGYDEGDAPEDAENVVTNFTYVSWEAIAEAFPTPLLVTPRADDPRR